MKITQRKWTEYTEVIKDTITICKVIDAKAFDITSFNDGVPKLRNQLSIPKKYELKEIGNLDEVKLLELK